MFNFFRKKEPKKTEPPRPVWIDADGNYSCPGDSCPKDCDMTCPIYINTMALMSLRMGNGNAAIDYYKKAVGIAPDFYDAWNNMGGAYGGKGDYMQAYHCYRRANELSPGKKDPLFGLALCCRDMGQYEEALKWCDKYDMVSPDGRTKSIRVFVAEKLRAQANEEPDWYNMDDDEVAGEDGDLSARQKYGKYYLMLLDESTREEGYRRLEEIEKIFPEAGIVLGQWYTAKGSDKANDHFRAAADAGIAEGHWGLASLMPHSYVPDPAIPEDALWEHHCLAAAEGECADAANEMGNVCNRRNCDVEAMYWYHLAYFLGKEDATVSISGITQKWIRAGKPESYKAGTEKCTPERFNTALIILKMYSGQKDADSTSVLMKKVLDGDLLAGFFLASLYENSNNLEMTFKVYNALAFTRSPNALRCYSDLLISGRGVKQDVPAALKYYEEAAEKGNAAAMFVMSQKALSDNDKYVAAYWAGAAYSRGYEPASAMLQKIKECK